MCGMKCRRMMRLFVRKPARPERKAGILLLYPRNDAGSVLSFSDSRLKRALDLRFWDGINGMGIVRFRFFPSLIILMDILMKRISAMLWILGAVWKDGCRSAAWGKCKISGRSYA